MLFQNIHPGFKCTKCGASFLFRFCCFLQVSVSLENHCCPCLYFRNSSGRKEYSRECTVCRLEGRNATTNTLYCEDHKVSLCLGVSKFEHLSPAACPDTTTCWIKFHEWYQPRYKAFTTRGSIARKGPVWHEIWVPMIKAKNTAKATKEAKEA